MRGEARISLGISCIGGKGALSSAIILTISSLDTCLCLSRMTEEGLVVTRMGVLGRVGLLGMLRMLAMGWSWPGNGVVGAGVGFWERDTASSSWWVESWAEVKIFLYKTELA